MNRWSFLAPYFLSLLRIASAVMLILGGTMKHFAWPVGMPPGNELQPWSQVWIGGWMEVIGGALLLVGLFTRPTAFILSGMLAVAYWQFHYGTPPNTPGNIWPTVNGGVPAALYAFVLLYISAAGAGPLSLDALLRRRQPGDLEVHKGASGDRDENQSDHGFKQRVAS